MEIRVLRELAEDPVAFLKQARIIKKQIALNQEQRQGLRLLAESITPVLSKAPGGSKGRTSDRVANAAIAIADLDTEILADTKLLTATFSAIKQTIHSYVTDSLSSAILEARYLNGYTWDAIANLFYMTKRWAQTLHDRAIEEIEDTAAKELRRRENEVTYEEKYFIE